MAGGSGQSSLLCASTPEAAAARSTPAAGGRRAPQRPPAALQAPPGLLRPTPCTCGVFRQVLQEANISAACARTSSSYVDPDPSRRLRAALGVSTSVEPLKCALGEVHGSGAPQGDLLRGGLLQRRRQRDLQQVRPCPGLWHGAFTMILALGVCRFTLHIETTQAQDGH